MSNYVSELRKLVGHRPLRNFMKIDNGDEFHSVTVAYYTKEVKGILNINESESLGFNYFHSRELPYNVAKSHRKMINKFLELNI